MGSFVFKWEHPASEVFVTGTFDDWSKSEQLIKTGNTFEKNVTLPNAQEKIYYKFVVDGNWVTDHTAPQETDPSGNLNNVLTTDRITKHTPATAGIMSGVAPTSTTADLAKDVPLEKAGSSDLPGTFPETPAAEAGEFSVNPIPEPGHTLTSGVHDDPELVANDKAKQEGEQTVGVSPLPAFAGGVNPVKVAPGEKLPETETLTGNSIHNNITLDKESYEKSGGLGNAPVLPPVVTPQAEREQNGTGVLDMPPISKNLIPESSLPMGAAGVGTFDATPTIQSAGPQSTTSQLAANVPLESTKVPEVVKESQQEAGFAPEASAVPEEVKEKSAVEKELLSEVPVAPTTSEGTAGKGTDKSEKTGTAGEAAAAVGGAAVALGGAAAAYASGAASKLPASVTSKLPESVQNSLNSTNATPATKETAATETPEVVKESIAESGQSPEAAAYTEPVAEKKAVEQELLKEVKPETSSGEPAPKIAETPAAPVPQVAEKKLETPRIDSRDVSPGTVPGSHSQPNVTTGVASATTDTVTAPETPKKDTASKVTAPSSSKVADSPASTTATDKKKKRTSFFGKLKAKFSDKEKK
ncbi:hypothetical protein BP5796_02360 [Coleophoma crateriformis]|uniref:AMP-activated protein kinase glycogen-binding domain-containing protein n=1 Tax=Coleophoma crateriformis TaxID=565419 RepID=A0A3D8SY06_9HELO|nr:hypothetical protein BP5796_02360 [Coleophoma crateriformis]